MHEKRVPRLWISHAANDAVMPDEPEPVQQSEEAAEHGQAASPGSGESESESPHSNLPG